MDKNVLQKSEETLDLTKLLKHIDEETWLKLRSFILRIYHKNPKSKRILKKMKKKNKTRIISIVANICHLVDLYLNKYHDYVEFMGEIRYRILEDKGKELMVKKVLSDFFKKDEGFQGAFNRWLHPSEPIITYRPYRRETRYTKNTFG